MSDIRKAKMCAKGARDFFESQGGDFQEFLENGKGTNYKTTGLFTVV